MIADNNGGLPRYCHPFHGGWDVARIALNIPESRILFVCPVSCARIIMLNALEFGYDDRIDVLGLTEADIVSGDYENKTLEAAREILSTVEVMPKAFMIYLSCIDAMLGNDHEFQVKEIMKEFPQVNCFTMKMCPITRYSSDLPLVQLQKDMYSPLPALNPSNPGHVESGANIQSVRTVAFIGSNIAPNEDDEIAKLLKDNGIRILHIGASAKYEDYLAVRESALNICFMPFAKSACEMLKNRYQTEYLPVFMRHDYDYIDATIEKLCKILGIDAPDTGVLRAETEKLMKDAAKCCKYKIAIDSTATLFPEELKVILEDAGFDVAAVFRDGTGMEGEYVDSGSISMPGMRKYGSEKQAYLALGEVAGSFTNAQKCIPLFYDNGGWGYGELKKIARQIIDSCADGGVR